MSNMKVCPNGHMYDAGLDNCPYCPSADTFAQTIVDNAGGDGNATLVDSGADRTLIDTPGSRSGKKVNHKATMIMSSDDDSLPEEKMTDQRKLVAWIACFTWDSFGKSYEIREGKTSIGADPSSAIHIDDPGMTGSHAQLLYRSGKLRIKDNFSTNGTFVNGKDIEADPYVLQDGDVITTGKTEFKLRLIDGGE